MRKSPGVSANVCEAVGRNSFLFPVDVLFNCPDKTHHQRVIGDISIYIYRSIKISRLFCFITDRDCSALSRLQFFPVAGCFGAIARGGEAFQLENAYSGISDGDNLLLGVSLLSISRIVLGDAS